MANICAQKKIFKDVKEICKNDFWKALLIYSLEHGTYFHEYPNRNSCLGNSFYELLKDRTPTCVVVKSVAVFQAS